MIQIAVFSLIGAVGEYWVILPFHDALLRTGWMSYSQFVVSFAPFSETAFLLLISGVWLDNPKIRLFSTTIGFSVAERFLFFNQHGVAELLQRVPTWYMVQFWFFAPLAGLVYAGVFLYIRSIRGWFTGFMASACLHSIWNRYWIS